VAAKLHSGQIDSFKIEKRYVRKDGSIIWVCITVAEKRDADGEPLYDISIVEDISDRKSAEARVEYLATHDEMTGLPNRSMFTELLGQAIKSSERYGRRFGVLFIDLDRFKAVNDSLGHEAGDTLLKEMADRFKRCVRASDVVARLGGDEFVMLIDEIAESDQAAVAARHVISGTLKPVSIKGHECRVTASVGIAIYPDHARDAESLMKNADMAMYLAKQEGKNNFQFFSKEIRASSIERMTLESHLSNALDRGEFLLQYQAKVSIRTGEINGVEALLRWWNSELGAVSPAQFIPVAEDTGLIVPIGKWVMLTACAQSVAWQQAGLSPVCMAVNVSPRQFKDPRLLDDIAEVLRATGADPSLLELEITESMVMHNVEQAVQKLRAIKEMGVRLAIDDFGTGYSSLAQLKRFPIDTLKVDRSFIREIPTNAEDRAITEAVIAMGRTLGVTVVAEGVETAEQQTFLSSRSCDEMQGYYFSKPSHPDRFATLLRKHVPAPRV
jgi:diguanylate cyclase (GGDEF)-like protein